MLGGMYADINMNFPKKVSHLFRKRNSKNNLTWVDLLRCGVILGKNEFQRKSGRQEF
jgi:hypothetical protein